MIAVALNDETPTDGAAFAVYKGLRSFEKPSP